MRSRVSLAAVLAWTAACGVADVEHGMDVDVDELGETELDSVQQAAVLAGPIVTGPVTLPPLTLCPSNVDPQMSSAVFSTPDPNDVMQDANILYAAGNDIDVTVVARNCTNADLFLDGSLVPTAGGGIDPPSTLHTIVSTAAVANMPGFSRTVHRLHRNNLGQGNSHTLQVVNRSAIVTPGNNASSSQQVTLVDAKEVEDLMRMSVSYSELLNRMGRGLDAAIGDDGKYGEGSGHLYDFHWNHYFFELLPTGKFQFRHHMKAYVPNSCDPDVYIDGKFDVAWNETTDEVDIVWDNGKPDVSFDVPWYCDIGDFLSDAFIPKMLAKSMAIGNAKQALSVGFTQLINDVIPDGCTGSACDLTVMKVSTDDKALHFDLASSARHFKVVVPYQTHRFADPAGQGIAFNANRNVSIVGGGIASVGGVKYPYPAYVSSLPVSAGGLTDFDKDDVVTASTPPGSDGFSIRASMHFLDRAPNEVFLPEAPVASLVGRLELATNTNLSNGFPVGQRACVRTRAGGNSTQDRLVLVPNDGPGPGGSERGTGSYEATLILADGNNCAVPLSAVPPVVVIGGPIYY